VLILAVETSGDVCSVAVRDDDGLLAERAFRHRMHLSERLIGDVEAVLTDAETDLRSIEALAVGIGPGSFTGLRVGVATVKIWAHLLDNPVAGISSLEAVAFEYSGLEGALIVALIRNRPDSVHMQTFRAVATAVEPLGGPAVIPVPDIADRLAAESGITVLCGDGLERHRDVIAPRMPAGVLFGRTDSPRASVIAAIASRRICSGQTDDPISLTPMYVAPPPIGPPSKRLP